MKKKITRVILTILVVACIGATSLFLLSRNPRSSIDRVVDLQVLVKEIQHLSELVSVKYTVQKVVGLEERSVPFGSEKLLLIVQAEVLAGVDLSELTVDDVSMSSERQVTVSLPRPSILHVVLDEENTKVWDRQITWWTPWVPFNPDLERKARLTALESVRETAVGMGILDDAQRSAEETISTLMEALGIQDVLFRQTSS